MMTGKTPEQRAPLRATPVGFKRVRADHATELAEDYVELIGDLIRTCGEARSVDIAQRLGVSHVTVNRTISRLKRDGLVISEPYRSIFLTEKGQRLADEARRRHDLVLAFLIRLGVPPADAEVDAEGMEHHLSPSTLEAMRRFVAGASNSGHAESGADVNAGAGTDAGREGADSTDRSAGVAPPDITPTKGSADALER